MAIFVFQWLFLSCIESNWRLWRQLKTFYYRLIYTNYFDLCFKYFSFLLLDWTKILIVHFCALNISIYNLCSVSFVFSFDQMLVRLFWHFFLRLNFCWLLPNASQWIAFIRLLFRETYKRLYTRLVFHSRFMCMRTNTIKRRKAYKINVLDFQSQRLKRRRKK